MRWVVVAMMGLGLGLACVEPAAAADYGYLRGSTGYAPTYRNWQGFYVGGQGGVGSGGANFNGASNDIVAHMLRNSLIENEAGVSSWATVGRADTGTQAQYGAFIGYNGQWGDVVLGLDASYNHTKINATDVDGLTRIVGLADGNTYIITSTATSQITLEDFATVRGRIGYAFDRFLPYATAGVALGRASYSTTARVSYPIPTVTATGLNSTLPAIDMSETEGKSNSLIYGWSAGLGMDVAITHNIFLRAEYEYIQFSQMKLNLNNARAGIGVKF